jgi:hypothetical protein
VSLWYFFPPFSSFVGGYVWLIVVGGGGRIDTRRALGSPGLDRSGINERFDAKDEEAGN